ncbi:MAG: response regulator/pilus assembly protein [Phascolarctobacterium sp.]
MAQKIRVCIWDEDSDSRAGMLRVLGNLDDYQVTEYRSGAGGIANLENLRPQILLLDVDYTIAQPAKLVPELRKSLPDLKIIALGKRWDESSRQIFNDLGFDAMLLKPLDVESFLKAVESANQDKSVKSNCQVLSFFSPKGKSGRTTLIVNLALALARVSGEKVGIIDAETNFADMDAFLNLNPRSTIVEALRDLTYLTSGTLEKYFEEVSDKVFVLCGANTPQQAAFVEPEGLTKLINLARPNFRYLLVDLAPGFNPISIAAAEASEKVYLTTMAGGTFEIKHLKRAMEIFQSLDNWQQRVGCVITRMAPDVRRAKELEEQIGCPVTLIPNEYLLCSEAANNGRMAVDIGSGSPLTQQIDRMAFAIHGGGR